MSGWELKIIKSEARRLVALAAQDADLRADLRALAQEILAATEAGDPPDGPVAAAPPVEGDTARSPAEALPPTNAGDTVSHASTTPEFTQGERVPGREPLRELTLGRRTPSPISTPQAPNVSDQAEADVEDLDQLVGRCRKKAEVARRAAERQRRVQEGTEAQVEDAPTDPEMVEWADRLTDGFYWLNAPDASQPADLSPIDELGGCFEAVAEGLSLVAGCEGRRGAIERALPLLAEAQSMLRRALQRLQAPDDADQLASYEWVRETAARHRIFLKRYMRADDRADPSRWPDLLARIEALTGGDRQARRQGARIEQVRPHQEHIQDGDGTADDWRAVIEAVEDMIGEGVPPSSRAIRELLLPVLDEMPDLGDLPPGFRAALREIDRYLATRPAPSVVAHPKSSAEVEEAARLLGGRSVVLIGGARRRGAQEALESAFGLKGLVWVETREHQSIQTFEPAIARPDVALVLLAIRWSSHAFGDVKHYCERHGKPLVRLPGGYHPNQVAAQILSQCGERLRGG